MILRRWRGRWLCATTGSGTGKKNSRGESDNLSGRHDVSPFEMRGEEIMRRDENRFKRGAGGKKGNRQRGESLDLSSCCDRPRPAARWRAAAYLMAVFFLAVVRLVGLLDVVKAVRKYLIAERRCFQMGAAKVKARARACFKIVDLLVGGRRGDGAGWSVRFAQQHNKRNGRPVSITLRPWLTVAVGTYVNRRRSHGHKARSGTRALRPHDWPGNRL